MLVKSGLCKCFQFAQNLNYPGTPCITNMKSAAQSIVWRNGGPELGTAIVWGLNVFYWLGNILG